jgi:hypothetical protein
VNPGAGFKDPACALRFKKMDLFIQCAFFYT